MIKHTLYTFFENSLGLWGMLLLMLVSFGDDFFRRYWKHSKI